MSRLTSKHIEKYQARFDALNIMLLKDIFYIVYSTKGDLGAFDIDLVYLDADFDEEMKERIKRACNEDFLEYLIYAYRDGLDTAEDMLGKDASIDYEKMFATIGKEIDGKDYITRISEHIDKGELKPLLNLADSEFHRVFNSGMGYGGEVLGARYKKWVTMGDEKVRDTHFYLEGQKIPYDEKYLTYDGDSALYPGDFMLASNNCGCRCVLELSYE